MLINLSNHPSTKWPQHQLDTALSQYSHVEDLPFPHIDPKATTDQVLMVVEDYISKVKLMNAHAVHIMGELTFTYLFVEQCKQLGIACIAATTNRIVEDLDGKKVTTFVFEQFRNYF